MPQTTALEKPHVLTKPQYTKLLTDLKRIIQEGRKQAVQAVNQVLILMHWGVGKRITQENLTENAGYGDSIIVDLARGLNEHRRVLEHSVSFFKAYQDCAPRGRNLTYSHYRELSMVPIKQERDWYELQADTKGWTRDALLSAIKRNAYLEKVLTGKKQKVSQKLKRPTDPFYTFKVKVMRAIDGDTYFLDINVGFTMKKEQRVRAAGIDCPEMNTPEGRKAFEYVRDLFAKLPFIVIKTNKVDIYGRYVAHVFYSFTEKNWKKVFLEGRYLNQELLDLGLAKRI